jgi:formate hydrogenlyase subunit 6/NADH:ubiquinone oxidoreductase subunit I
MTFYAFAHQYFLWFALLFLPTALFLRFIFSIRLIIQSAPRFKKNKLKYITSVLSRSFFPLNSLYLEKPHYSFLRLFFHVTLIALPVWLPMHVFTLSYSRLGLAWTPLPLHISEILTIMVIMLCAVFFLRRVLISKIRRNSNAWDFLLLGLVAAPFTTGYLSVHDPFGSRFQFLSDNMYTLHVITGEIMLIVVGFLFIRVYLDKKVCIACAACTENCPTQALAYQDLKTDRFFYYSHYRCIACATCMSICPVNAVSLKHVISLRRFIQLKPKSPILSHELIKCDLCERSVASVGQIGKIEEAIGSGEIKLCERCRRLYAAFLLE